MFRSKEIAFLVLSVTSSFFIACTSDISDEESHQKMLKILQSIPDESNLESNPFENRTRLAWLQKIKSQGFDRGVEHNISIAREMLRSGYTVNAIELITSVLDTMSTKESFFYNYSLPLTDLLAISYFRLGEDENCLHINL